MSALLIALPTAPVSAATEFGYAVTHDGATVAQHGSAAAPLLPVPARAGSEVVAIVPTPMLSWHRVELPKGVTARSPRLRAALEGLLEDRLLDEPEQLHFALPPQWRPESEVWVATCDRAWLRAAVQMLEAAGRPVNRIVPEFAPEGRAMLHALGEPHDALLVLSGQEGVTALPLAPTALSLLPSLPEDTPCLAEPAVAALAEQVLQHTPTLQSPADRWVRAAQSDWDLAQFEFSSSARARTLKRVATVWADILAAPQWRPLRWGAVLLVAINLVGLNAWAWRDRAALDAKREGIRGTLTQTFPQVRVVVDAPVQMEREVTALRQATGGSSGRDLEAMLGVLSTAVPAQRAIAGLDYTNGELRVRGITLSADEQRSITAALKAQGYAVVPSGDSLTITAEALP